MPAFIDLTGQRFGRWTVLRRSEERSGISILWDCKCRCGTERSVRTTHLRNGRSTSCGICKSEKMRGRQFGWLTVVKAASRDKWGRDMWLCECACGAERVVPGPNLRKGKSLSCGAFNHAGLPYDPDQIGHYDEAGNWILDQIPNQVVEGLMPIFLAHLLQSHPNLFPETSHA